MEQQIPTITINCWPGIEYPAILAELDDHKMRRDRCERILAGMSADERKATDTPEGWQEFLKTYWDYDPKGYVKPVVTREQREEWRANQSKKRFYVVSKT